MNTDDSTSPLVVNGGGNEESLEVQQGAFSFLTLQQIYKLISSSSVVSGIDLVVLALHSLFLDVGFIPVAPPASSSSSSSVASTLLPLPSLPDTCKEECGTLRRQILPSSWNEDVHLTGVYSFSYIHPLWHFPVAVETYESFSTSNSSLAISSATTTDAAAAAADDDGNRSFSSSSSSSSSCVDNQKKSSRMLQVKCVVVCDDLLAIHAVDTGDSETLHSLDNLNIRQFINPILPLSPQLSSSSSPVIPFFDLFVDLPLLCDKLMSGLVGKIFAGVLFPIKSFSSQVLLSGTPTTSSSSCEEKGKKVEEDEASKKRAEEEKEKLAYRRTLEAEEERERSRIPQIPDRLGRFSPDGELIGPYHPGFGNPNPFAGGRGRGRGGVHFDPYGPFGDMSSGEPNPDHMPYFGGMPDHMFF